MKKDKISAQDIIDHLSANDVRTKRVSEDFVKAFIASIEEALQSREWVKIKNLGTFKLNWIAPRKSVNVQTGEQILISGYYKVIFSPDNSLKKIVNKPFEHLETVILDIENDEKSMLSTKEEINPISVFEEQANEIKGLLNEIKETSIIQSEEIKDNEKSIIVGKEKPVVLKEVKNEEKKAPIKSSPPEEVHSFPTTKNKKNWLWVLLTSLVVLTGVFFLFYKFNPNFNNWINTCLLNRNIEMPVVIEEKETPVIVKEVKEIPVIEENVIDEWEVLFHKRLNNPEYIATEKLSAGSRLAFLSEKYYGSPYFWVYIYEANKEKIKNPNLILQGTVIRIPKIDKSLLDTNNPRNIEKALELKDIYLK